MGHSIWMASSVFDGARAFEGTAPDLDLHCARVIASAQTMLLRPNLSAETIHTLICEGLARLPISAELYIRPLFYAEDGFIVPDLDSTCFALSLFEMPMPLPAESSLCLSSYRRSSPDMAPTFAKASCLYPNSARALHEAAERGFDNALMLDANGNVAETCMSNIWLAQEGIAKTPIPNGTFLDGITKNRVKQLLRKDGLEVLECSLTYADFMGADEIFTTGNYGKVMPITRIEDRILQPGPIYQRARKLYWEFAHATAKTQREYHLG